MSHDAAPVTAERRRVKATEHLTSEEGVYGVILVAGMIVVSNAHDATAWEGFVTVMVTVFVFWAAHVYAGTVAHHGVEGEHVVGLRESFRGAVHRSMGLLVSSLIPASILLLGATDRVPDGAAIQLSLWAGVIVLAVLGYRAFARRGSGWWMRVVGALATAGFGVLMIALKAVIH